LQFRGLLYAHPVLLNVVESWRHIICCMVMVLLMGELQFDVLISFTCVEICDTSYNAQRFVYLTISCVLQCTIIVCRSLEARVWLI